MTSWVERIPVTVKWVIEMIRWLIVGLNALWMAIDRGRENADIRRVRNRAALDRHPPMLPHPPPFTIPTPPFPIQASVGMI